MPGHVAAGVRRALVLLAALALSPAIGCSDRGARARASERPELQRLFAALEAESTRPASGRLTGGVAYARPRPETRGPGNRTISPDVRIAAALLDKRARETGSAADSAAAGTALLALGEWDQAVEALQAAADVQPGNLHIQNDLSVAYLARAAQGERPEDWVSSLAAAQRALALDASRPEPHFNRALALGGLHLGAEEADAWAAYRSIERTGPWSVESAERLAAFEAARREDEKTALTGGDYQAIREQVEDDLLRGWGAAFEAGRVAEAERLLAETWTVADGLARRGGDPMARDEVARIRRAQATGDAAMVRALAVGHRLYGEARERFLANRERDANALMTQAAVHLRRAGSPYWHYASITQAIYLRNDRRVDEGLAQLARVPVAGIPPEYRSLRGRLAWIESLLYSALGRYDVARDGYTQAIDAFRSVAEHDSYIATLTNRSEAEWYLGNRGRAWADVLEVLTHVESRGGSRRTAHFALAAVMADEEGLPEAGLEFHEALVRRSNRGSPVALSQAHLLRARSDVRLGNYARATGDLAQAVTAMEAVGDPVLRERASIEIQVTRAELFERVDCPQAITLSTEILTALPPSDGTVRRGALFRVRAKCLTAAGNFEEARNDLRAAIDVFERRRQLMASATDRMQSFDLERSTYRDLIALEAVNLNDERAALTTAERARAGVVAEAWTPAAAESRDHSDLPADVAVVYFESLADRVQVWVMTREDRIAFTRPLDERELRRSVDRIGRAIQQGADLAALRPLARPIVEALITPALAAADRFAGTGSMKPRVVFVPDGPLFALPFGALPDAQGRPLLETRTVAVTPSLSTFFAASARLAAFRPTGVLAVGDGHDPVATGLPKLAHADGEAADVARIYPQATLLTGADATKRRLLAAPAPVVHFAGHSVVNERFPLFSRLLLAPEAGDRESGAIFATEITQRRFGATDVVVLASCESAAGRGVDGEGALSVARAFFAAGVPAVAASLWPVDDDLQTLVREFHQTLRTERDPAAALRAGQRAILAERGLRTPVRVWGGFVLLGGLAPRRG